MSDPDYYRDPSPRRGIALPLIGLLIAFALGIGLTFYAVRRWQPVARLVQPAVTVKAVPVVVPTPRPAAPQTASTPDLIDVARLGEIEARIDAIEQRAAAASGDADRAEGLLITFAARRALDRGQPLGYLEGMLRDRFGGREAASVAMVIAASQRPITLAQLQDGFAGLSTTLATTRSNESWWRSVQREMGSLFVIRRDNQPSAIPERTLARAEHALDQGQVDAAAAEVARLPGSARATAWLASARRYVLAHAALDRLETAALLAPPADPVMQAAPMPPVSTPPTSQP